LTTDLRWVPAQTFTMGSDRHHPEEAPAHATDVDGFWIERHPVTNAQFAAFVRATGYRTVAERPLDPDDFPGAPSENLQPGSMVFTGTDGPVDLRHLEQWWAWTPGAQWRRPEGRGSSLRTRPDHPVVHVAHNDAAAYATWAGRALPTETEWEAAARGGLDDATYTWGDEPCDGMANHWHGAFPWRAEPGYGTTTPVGRFPPNDYDLVDMAGNVWEWTDEPWSADHHARACCAPVAGATEQRVVKGGSFLCADEYCSRYRPAARRPQPIDTGMSHIGFRCLVRPSRAGGDDAGNA
jgi:formylglycine-generating enzyme